MASLDLDYGCTLLRAEEKYVDLDFASLGVGKPQSVDEELIVAKRFLQRVPDDTFRLRGEHWMFGYQFSP